MSARAHHLLGMSFAPIDDRVIVIKTPVIMTKAPTIIRDGTDPGARAPASAYVKASGESSKALARKRA